MHEPTSSPTPSLPPPSPPPIPPVPPGDETVGAGGPVGRDVGVPDWTPWGPWASLGWAVLVLVVSFGVQVLAAVGFLVLEPKGRAHADFGQALAALAGNGLYLSFAECLTLPVCGWLICLLAAKRGAPARGYLALLPVPPATLLAWMGIAVACDIATDIASLLLHHELVPEFMRSIYMSAGCYPLLWFSIILVGPFFEELLFRGFLFPGLARTKIGVPGAIFITAAFWAGLHMQYDWWGVAQVFLVGLLFGYARARTGSMCTTFGMHVMVNLQATLEAAYFVRGHFL